MTAELSVAEPHAARPTHKAVGPAVWDRLWRHEPTGERDDALLAREERLERWAMIVERLESAFGGLEGLKTIELGSGRGDLSVLLARRGAHVTLFDASDRALDQARRRFDRLGLPARFERGDMLGALDEQRDRFDVALSSGVIEHFRDGDRTRVIRAHRDVLRVSGMAIISVPNAWCLPYRLWKFYLEIRGCWPYGMEIPYSRREMLARASEAGFAEADATCMGFWQSISAHWGRGVLKKNVDWDDRRSVWDRTMGLVLLVVARK